MAQSPDDLASMVRANDKLLKAMIGLLALKDSNLLDELRMVFAMPVGGRRFEAGLPDEATWAHLRRELAAITAMVEEAEADDAAASPPAGLHS